MTINRWRLPEGVYEVLPPMARELEQMRRRVLDVFHSWGFDQIEPPIVEYLDALLVGGGDEVDLQTLKAVDQRSGRMLGVRADMTSQAVRIDAHSRFRAGVQRLCYAGQVVRANPASPLDARVLHKAGAEIFGEADITADAEVITLLAALLADIQVNKPVLVLGHMGIYQGLARQMGLSPANQRALFNAVQAKSETDIGNLLPAGRFRDQLVQLPTLMGGFEVLDTADALLADSTEDVRDACAELRRLARQLERQSSQLTLRFDVAELAGYGYHNGAVFSVYQEDLGRALARGGRYDGVGADFGRPRPATGFDINLAQLIVGRASTTDASVVWLPWSLAQNTDAALLEFVSKLRHQGQRVIGALSESAAPEPGCTHYIVSAAGAYALAALASQHEKE